MDGKIKPTTRPGGYEGRKDAPMTLHDVSTQLYNLTLGGFVNGEKFTKQQLEANLRRWMREPERLKIKNRLVIEICLQDGRWLATVDRFDDTPDGYDYYIPDTREQEQKLKDLLLA